MPWARAHGLQAAVALAASSWLTKGITLIEPQLVEPSMAWIQRRLDETSCVGELCARRPRAIGRRPWACAHGIQDVAPTGAKNG